MSRPMARWRKHSQAVIAQAMREHPEACGEALRALLRERYPFGERAHFPYKVWLSEVNRACGGPARTRKNAAEKRGEPWWADEPLFRRAST